MFVVHEFRNRNSKLLGGTVLHIYDLIDKLRNKMNFHVLYPENGMYKVSSFFEEIQNKQKSIRRLTEARYRLLPKLMEQEYAAEFEVIVVDQYLRTFQSQ